MCDSVAGLQYRFSIPNYLAVRAMHGGLPRSAVSGRIPGLEYAQLQPPDLPGPDWVRLRPKLSGICGSDMSLLTGRSSPALSPFTSFPAVMGHEILAEVREVGDEVRGIAAGDRVVVDPFISCEMRGLDPCPSCRSGQRCLCTQTAEGDLSPGMLIGFCRDLPGGWSQEIVVHRSQVYRVPPEVPDRVAVLVEPLSIGLHSVLKQPPERGSEVLVLGGGTVGMAVLAALRLLEIDCHVTVVARYPFQAEMATRLGADVIAERAERAVVDVARATSYRPIKGAPVFTGGFDWVYDCVGSKKSVDASMRVAGPGGKVTLVGCAGEVSRLDLSFIWARELNITGSYGYATESTVDGAPHTYEMMLGLLESRPDYPLADLVTHVYPLSGWRDAMRVNLDRARYGALKTVFNCQLPADGASAIRGTT